MKDNPPDIEILFGLAEDYGKTTFELLKLQAIDKSSKVFSSLTSKIILGLMAALFALCFNIGLAFWIGEILGKIYIGFFIVSAFYLIIALVVLVFKKSWIELPIRNSIIENLMDKEIS